MSSVVSSTLNEVAASRVFMSMLRRGARRLASGDAVARNESDSRGCDSAFRSSAADDGVRDAAWFAGWRAAFPGLDVWPGLGIGRVPVEACSRVLALGFAAAFVPALADMRSVRPL